MRKKSRTFINTMVAAFMLVHAFSLTGCGKTADAGLQTDREAQSAHPETQQGSPETETVTDIVLTQDASQEQGVGTGSMMRAYSDGEKERMAQLQQSYQNETVKPGGMIREVDNAEDVTEGTLCYIRSTGEYYLPDRELTDEELLEIIDCNFRIALQTNRKTQEEYEAEDRAERTMLEEKVRAAGGISEEKATEIARKAMEADLGERGRELKLCINETYGWSSDLCVADWSEIKKEDRGKIVYSIGFNNVEDATEPEELLNYICVVNAGDGSILEAYTIQGWGEAVYYKH